MALIVYRLEDTATNEVTFVEADETIPVVLMNRPGVVAGEYDMRKGAFSDQAEETAVVPALTAGTISQSSPTPGTELTVIGSNVPAGGNTAYLWQESDDDAAWDAISGETGASLDTTGMDADTYIRRGVSTGGQAMVYTPSVQLAEASSAVIGPQVNVDGDEGFTGLPVPNDIGVGSLFVWVGYCDNDGGGANSLPFINSAGFEVRLRGDNGRINVTGSDGSSPSSFANPSVAMVSGAGSGDLYAFCISVEPYEGDNFIMRAWMYSSSTEIWTVNQYANIWSFDAISTSGTMSLLLPTQNTPASLRQIRNEFHTGISGFDSVDLKSSIEAAIIDGNGEPVSDPTALSNVLNSTPRWNLYGDAARLNAEISGGSMDFTSKKSGTFVDVA